MKLMQVEGSLMLNHRDEEGDSRLSIVKKVTKADSEVSFGHPPITHRCWQYTDSIDGWILPNLCEGGDASLLEEAMKLLAGDGQGKENCSRKSVYQAVYTIQWGLSR
jgi:hypothetical protein